MSALSNTQTHLRYGFIGLVMGFALSRIGFSDFGEVHRMFVFADLRLLIVFAGAVAISMVLFAAIENESTAPKKAMHRGVVPGSMLFGAGWAVSGACPGIALVQLGEGRVPALFTVLGIGFGAWVYREVHARFLRWDTGSCDS